MKFFNHKYFVNIIASLLVCFSNASLADQFPSKSIRIIVPFGAGSGSDANARYYGEKISAILGQPVIVENKPGADATIGMMAAKAAPADGYTLVQGGISPSVVNAVVFPNLAYDPVKDFTPVLGYARNMNVILVPNNSKYKSFTDLIEEGKKLSKPLLMGTFSTTLSLSGAWLGHITGLKFTNVPYKGQSQVMTDIMGDHLDMAMVDLGGASVLVRENKVRALAVTGENRSPDFPNVPTVKESGYPEFFQYSWNALFIRSDTPESIRKVLGDAVKKVMTSQETIEKYHRPRGTEVIPLSPDQLQKLQQEEIDRFRQVKKIVDFSAQ
jgi:tripartite-type tricarboxylate transporter receptor subunit TctC